MEQKVKIITYRGRDGKDAEDLKPFVSGEISRIKEELSGLIASYSDSQNLANGIVDRDLRDLEDKLSSLEASINDKSDLQQLQADLLKIVENINASFATKKELKTLESDLKGLIPAPISVISGSENVKITKEENTFKVAVDVPEITREITKEIEVRGGGGVSKATVQKMIDSAVEGIEISGGGGGTVTDITSVDGSVVVSPIATGYNLAVADRYVNISGDTMLGQLTMSGAGIQLDTNYTPSWVEGKIFYDSVNHTLAYYNDNSEVTINVGQESVVRVRNSTGSTIANGKAVVVQGSTGNHPNIILASNLSSTSHDTIGVATHDINNNEDGFITVQGMVNGLNTSSFSNEGVTLWLGTNGDLTETEPTAPTHKVKIGYLIRKHNNQGRILVAIDTGSDLGSLHDVSIGDYEDGALLVANGSVWSPGANVNDFTSKTEVSTISGGFNSRISTLETINFAENEPTGFENRTDSTVSYNASTRNFSITGNYNVWLDAVKYPKTGNSTTLTATYGTQFIKYGSGGAFNVSSSAWSLSDDAPIAYVFFNSGATDSFAAEERHGITMDGVTHRYLHYTHGAQYKSGLAIGDYTLNSDTVSHNKYSITTGNFFDEDIENVVAALPAGGPYNVFYRTGATGEWTWSKSEAYPYLINSNSIRYNEFTGATWQLTNVTIAGRWVNYYVFATNAITSGFGIIIIPGQQIYSTLANAQNESIASLNFGSLPFQEIVPLYRVTHQFSSSFATANGRARIVAISDLKATSFNAAIAASSGNHNSLSGLQGGTAGEYFHLTSSQVSDLIGRTEVASISGNLQTQINLKQNEITLVAGSGISISESPADTWTISVSGGGGGGLTITQEDTAATRYMLFTDVTSGTGIPYVDDEITYNPSTNIFTVKEIDLRKNVVTSQGFGYAALRGNLVSGTNNTSVGFASLFTNSSGTDNTAVGSNALTSNQTGNENSAIGSNALLSSTSANWNTSVGFNSLYNTLTGGNNTAVGHSALKANTASNNTAVGQGALQTNSSGTRVLAVGNSALNKNTTASDNTAIGYQALFNNTTGTFNCALGNYSLYNNISGSYNTSVGHNSLKANTTGIRNNAFGYLSLEKLASGNYNVAIGDYSLGLTTATNESTAVGTGSLYNNTTGELNTAIGYSSLGQIRTGNRNVGVGHGAGSNSQDSSYSTYIGYGAGTDATTGACSYRTAIGAQATVLSDSTIRCGRASTDTLRGYNYTADSDRRLKENIQDLTLGLDFLMTLRPVTFKWRDRTITAKFSEDGTLISEEQHLSYSRTHAGFIAQEIGSALVSAGVDLGIYQDAGVNKGITEEKEVNLNDFKEPEDLKGYSPEQMLSIAVKAIQELKNKVDLLQGEINTLKGT